MADRPRNFNAMRDDRVIAMASREFNRSFASASEARQSLAALPIERQRALKKPQSPNIKAIQQAHQMTQAGQEQRYVNRMVAAGSAKTPEQLVAEFKAVRPTVPSAANAGKPRVGSSRAKALMKEGVVTKADVKGASSWRDVEAIAARGRQAQDYDRGITPRQPKPQWDSVARGMSKNNQTMLQLESEITRFNEQAAATKVAAGPSMGSRLSAAAGHASTGLLAISVGAAAVQGYNRARDHGDSVGVAAAKGALNAAPAAFVAGAPYIERGATAFAEGAFSLAGHLSEEIGVMDMVFLDAMFAKGTAVAGAVGALSEGVALTARVASKFALPAALAVGAVSGALKDENRLRGAARGAVSAFDPTALFMNKGLAERGFNAVFGEQDRPLSSQPRMNQMNPGAQDYRGRGYLNQNAQRRAETAPSPSAAPLRVASAPVMRSDGETDAYTRVFRGKTVSVKSYTTPARS